ncbi:hypothetical protein T4C_2717, partial [Trichinella pseudospiralis]
FCQIFLQLIKATNVVQGNDHVITTDGSYRHFCSSSQSKSLVAFSPYCSVFHPMFYTIDVRIVSVGILCAFLIRQRFASPYCTSGL